MTGVPLEYRDVRFRRGGFRLDVNIELPAGRLTVVLGPSGCGKTTLLDLGAGFLVPESGRILEGRRDVTHLSPHQRRVGVVFQDHALFPHLSVRDNVAYGPRARGTDRRRARAAAADHLALVNMEGFADRRIQTLSGGERQRVALARALSIDPDFLLMDEPFSALDAALRRSLRSEVRRIQETTGITAVLVTHDQDEALSLADHLVVMDRGRVTQSGPPHQLWREPADAFTAGFLGRASILRIQESEQVSKDGVRVRSSAGIVDVDRPGIEAATTGILVIRPEDLRLDETGPISGIVESREFTGSRIAVRLRTGDESSRDILDCDLSAEMEARVGDRLRFSLRPGGGWIIPGDG